MYKKSLLLLFFVKGVLIGGVEESIVCISTECVRYDYDNPWQAPRAQSVVGSGFVIGPNRILTNAHVVANQTFIQVHTNADDRRHQATVEFVGHDCDLAILKLVDDSVLSEAPPLDFGQMVAHQDRIRVYGFPEGGAELSVSSGIVSRIEVGRYAHSDFPLLNCQVDAAINPGNSGGPALDESGHVVGVVHQGMDGDGQGFIIPIPVIQHFLADVSSGSYDGFCDLGIAAQFMENVASRRFHEMKESDTGVLLTNVAAGSICEGFLEPGDVVSAIDGHQISNRGTYLTDAGYRLAMTHLVHQRYPDQKLDIEYLRGGVRQNVSVTVQGSTATERLVRSREYDRPPSYLVHGGMVFQPLSINYLEEWGPEWRVRARTNLLYQLHLGERTKQQREVVVLSKVLPHSETAGYQNMHDLIVKEVNGIPIGSMEELAKVLDTLDEPFIRVLTEEGLMVTLDREAAEAAQNEILEAYRIPGSRSDDLACNIAVVGVS